MLASSPAAGQGTACADRDKIVELLARKYQESPVARGVVTNGGHLMELFTSDETWTLIVSQPNGMSCAIASGEGWRTIDKPRPEGTAL